MAKAALDVSAAFKGVEMGAMEAPAQPAPIRVQQMPLLPFLFAEVSINGQGPFRFLVDTGATQTVLSQKVATKLGLKKIATNIMFGVGGAGKGRVADLSRRFHEGRRRHGQEHSARHD